MLINSLPVIHPLVRDNYSSKCWGYDWSNIMTGKKIWKVQHITASNLGADVKVEENIVDKKIRSVALLLPQHSWALLRSCIPMTMVMEDFPFIFLELGFHTSLLRCLSPSPFYVPIESHLKLKRQRVFCPSKFADRSSAQEIHFPPEDHKMKSIIQGTEGPICSFRVAWNYSNTCGEILIQARSDQPVPSLF